MCAAATIEECFANFPRWAVSLKMDNMVPNQALPEIGTALFTDLYELTMAQAYDVEQLDKQAVFELAFRTLPQNRNFVLAAGLDEVLTALEQWHFGSDDL